MKIYLPQEYFRDYSCKTWLDVDVATNFQHTAFDSQLEHVTTITSLRVTTDCMIDGNFGNVSAGVLISKVAYQGKRWKAIRSYN